MDTIAQSRDASLRGALYLAAVLATIKLLLHVVTNLWQTHLGYSYFRDEMYYLICGRHLAWGYVDHGPLVALQARAAELLFGDSLTGIRMFTALAGAGRVFLTGILAWSLGGSRPAQALAMIGVLASPQFLSIDSFLSMNSAESLFWMGCLLALIIIQRGGSQKIWLLFGLSAGLGLLNKPSMTFFLFAVLFALLLTPQRKLLFSRWAVLGTALLVLIALPNLAWQQHNHWPTLEFLLNARHSNKNPRLPPLTFLGLQILYHDPATMMIWGTGLAWLLAAKDARLWRWLGLTFLFFLAQMMVLHGNHYYVSPIYPILFAAGGVAWEHFFAARKSVLKNRSFAFPYIEALVLGLAVFTLPWSIPVLPPAAWLRYMKATHLYALSINEHGRARNSLPLFFADRFGLAQQAAVVARVYQALSPEDRAKAAIVGSNYGEASAVNFLGPKFLDLRAESALPFAISGQNNYFLWGPHYATGELLIAVTPQTPEALAKAYDSVEIAGRADDPWSLPGERVNIYILRGRHTNLTEDWPNLKDYY